MVLGHDMGPISVDAQVCKMASFGYSDLVNSARLLPSSCLVQHRHSKIIMSYISWLYERPLSTFFRYDLGLIAESLAELIMQGFQSFESTVRDFQLTRLT